MDDAADQRPPRRPRLLRPFVAGERGLERFVNWLGSLALFQLLEYAGRLTVLVAVIFYFLEAPERCKQAHYQAWQLINSAQGQTGSGGRIEALQDLNNDHVSLVGLAAPNAHLEGINLPNAILWNVNLSGANLSSATLNGADIHGASLTSATLNGATLTDADLSGADLSSATLTYANFAGAYLTDTNLEGADLEGADLREVEGLTIDQIKAAKNWELAKYDDAFHAQIGLPPAPPQTPYP